MPNETTALARRQETAPVAAPFEPADLDQAYTLAENLSKASLLPSYLRGKPADVFMTLLLGRDLGLTAMQAITGIHVIEGKPSVSAQTAVALVKKSPLCVFFRLVEGDNTKAVYETHRKGEPAPARLSFTIEDAARAGLAGKNNWKGFPAAMLRARCSMALARDVYPDVVANVYDPDELDEAVERADLHAPPAAATPAEVVSAKAPAPPKRTAPCGTCGRAPGEHVAGPGPSGLAIDAACNLEPTTKAPDPTANPTHPAIEINGGIGNPPAAAAPQGFADVIDGPRLADMLAKRMDGAETMPQLDAVSASVKTGVADGTISDSEKGQLLQRYRDNKKRLAAVQS